MPRKRIRPLRIAALSLAAGALALQLFTTRGRVHSGPASGARVAGADVILFDSTGVVAHARTDRKGRFRFVHAPRDRDRHRVLICADRYGSVVTSATSALLRSTYGLPPRSASAALPTGWMVPAPPSCPPPAGMAASR